MANLRRSYDEFMIINMLIFKRSYDDFMILSYDIVMITNNFRLRLFKQNLHINKHKWHICPLS